MPRSPVLIARQTELATALRLLHAAGRGEGSTLLVTGEAGIGKSRLLAELARRAPAASMTVLRGRALGASTFRPMTEALAAARRVGQAALAAVAVRGDDHAELCLRLARAAAVGGR